MSAALGPVATTASPTELGAGGYGLILSPALPNNMDGTLTEFPENITKLFFHPRYYEKALVKYAEGAKIMGANAGHRFSTYKKKYTGANLPEALRTKYKITPDAPLYPIRMPNLGKDIFKMDPLISALRKVPIPVILQQILKVLGQVHRLRLSNYVHGDIRDYNIMVKPDGVITIIDFDWLYPKDEFFRAYSASLGFYYNPPESLVFESALRRLDDDLNSVRWVDHNLTHYPHVFSALGLDRTKIYRKITATIFSTKDEIGRLGHRSVSESFVPILFPFFDSYGLSFALLEFLTKVYGPSILHRDPSDAGTATFIGDLRGLGVQKGEAEYGGLEFRECASKLLGIAQLVLLPMANLSRAERIAGNAGSILTRYPIAEALIADLTAKLAPVAEATSGAEGGAGTGGLLRGFGSRGGLPAPSTLGLTRQAGTLFRPANLANLKHYAPKNNDGKERRTRRTRRS